LTTASDAAYQQTAAALDGLLALQNASAAVAKYTNAFTIPFLLASHYFNRLESERVWSRTPAENWSTYLKLGTMNVDLAGRALSAGLEAARHFFEKEIEPASPCLVNGDCGAVYDLSHRMAALMNRLVHEFPQAIDAVEDEFGFHFERQPASSKIDETDRFILYQVLPTDPAVEPATGGKPLLIIPPFVLGANILSFLPGDRRSYAHAFANQGIPTYVRVLKDIAVHEAVQEMMPEDDALDNHRFCTRLAARHDAPVTLNGYCQGGFTALCDLLSGKLDDVVDALITCVAPMDGTRSRGLTQFLKTLPRAFNDLAYGTKMLPSGIRVADGTLMGWIYKLKSIETESPLLALWRDMMLLGHSDEDGQPAPINKTAAALNYWLTYERSDLPMGITEMSYASYNIPISATGTLPITMFGRELNLHRLKERKVPWQICYGLNDDLVEPETALAPLDFIDVETAPFPKGHVAIATSWSHPKSKYALHTRFNDGKARGPVRFQLDLQDELLASRKPAAKAPKQTAASSRSGTKTPPVGRGKASNAHSPKKAPAKSKAQASRKRTAGKAVTEKTP
jgi:hypothetical protein